MTIVVEASGEQLLGALENSVSQLPKQEGRFAQVGGCARWLAGCLAGGAAVQLTTPASKAAAHRYSRRPGRQLTSSPACRCRASASSSTAASRRGAAC
jgi:hypothetical protein